MSRDLPSCAPLRRIACLLYPGVMSLDVTGPLQAFATANDERQRHGLSSACTLHVLADRPGPVATSAGFSLLAEQARDAVDAADFDTALVPRGNGVIHPARRKPCA